MKNMEKPKLAISFSGGRTSRVMTELCVEKFKDTHDIAITFANTGCEHENTLKYVNDCDKHFGWGVVWVEAVINPEAGQGTRHKIVNFETASRNGEPFEAATKKYGLPNPVFQWCTRELKEHAMRSYLRDCLGWPTKSFWTAIGIRADEMDRVSAKRLEHKFVYPLVDAGWTKDDVKRHCAKDSFDLDLKGEHYGNCVWCWKKSMRKLMTLAKDDESIYDFPRHLEDNYKYHGANAQDGRQMFRKHMTTVDIIELARTGNFEPYQDVEQLDMGFNQPNYDVELDTGSACGESCEIGADYE